MTPAASGSKSPDRGSAVGVGLGMIMIFVVVAIACRLTVSTPIDGGIEFAWPSPAVRLLAVSYLS